MSQSSDQSRDTVTIDERVKRLARTFLSDMALDHNKLLAQRDHFWALSEQHVFSAVIPKIGAHYVFSKDN